MLKNLCFIIDKKLILKTFIVLLLKIKFVVVKLLPVVFPIIFFQRFLLDKIFFLLDKNFIKMCLGVLFLICYCIIILNDVVKMSNLLPIHNHCIVDISTGVH